EDDVRPGQHTEEQQLRDESVPIALLQRVVKTVVPLIEHDVDGHNREFDGYYGGEENAAGPAVLGEEIWAGKPEDDGERRSEACHGFLLVCRQRFEKCGRSGGLTGQSSLNWAGLNHAQASRASRLLALGPSAPGKGWPSSLARSCALLGREPR